jgi:hypothetical protein
VTGRGACLLREPPQKRLAAFSGLERALDGG